MKKLKEYEANTFNLFGKNSDTIAIVEYYRQAIKEILEEVVTKDEEYPPYNDLHRETKATIIQGRNQIRAEIRTNAAKVLGQ